MEDSSEGVEAAGLANIHLATTPQQSFERADRMLTQAASIRECGQALQEQVQLLLKKADNLHDSALQLQRQGMQERENISKIFKDTIEQYSHIITDYKSKAGYSVDKVELAVEDGRARMEEVEALGDKLFKFAKNTAAPNVMATSNLVDTDLKDDGVSSDESDVLLFSAPLEPEFDNASIEFSTASLDLNRKSSSISISEHGFVEPEPSDDGHEIAILDPKAETSAIPQLSNRKCKLERPPKAADSLNEDDQLPIFQRKKRLRTNREYRKKQLLSSMGYTDNEISEFDLNDIETPPRKKRPSGHQKRQKGIRAPFVFKQAPPQPPTEKD